MSLDEKDIIGEKIDELREYANRRHVREVTPKITPEDLNDLVSELEVSFRRYEEEFSDHENLTALISQIVLLIVVNKRENLPVNAELVCNMLDARTSPALLLAIGEGLSLSMRFNVQRQGVPIGEYANAQQRYFTLWTDVLNTTKQQLDAESVETAPFEVLAEFVREQCAERFEQAMQEEASKRKVTM